MVMHSDRQPQDFSIEVSPEVGFIPEALEQFLAEKYQFKQDEGTIRLKKRSIDARGKQMKVLLQGSFYPKKATPPLISFDKHLLPDVRNAPRVLIVGSGPAGMFCAIKLIELGLKPILIERGKDVRARRRDLAAINKDQVVNPESNYCFGEGGAGTYSDGKLYTRSVKRGNLQRVLDIFVDHGAKEDILFEAHPHIGTNKLPGIVAALRETIIAHGGEVHFNTRMVNLLNQSQQATGIETENGDLIEAEAIVLATGHSARDVFELLFHQGILIEAKPFALGLRIEHPQPLIDRMQYHCDMRPLYIPAASYSFVEQVPLHGQQRGVFSFCMCPGGFIVPAATAPGEIVVNGMSPSRRDGKFANSGMVVAIEADDVKEFQKLGPLAFLDFQRKVEQQAYKFGGGGQVAPAQRLMDFLQHRYSSELNPSSYQPGLRSADLHEVLPQSVAVRLVKALEMIGKKRKGYLSNEANLVGVESRTSSPVRIPRDPTRLMHPELEGLFPCGEGAGYAGGIISAAMDGERVAEAVSVFISSRVKKTI